jgi:large subunit ribosomal protein L3
MAKGLIGKKLGMTQIFDPETRQVVPVTVVEAGPCTAIQVKTMEKDGYQSVQLGYQEQKEQRVAKPMKGHFAKHNAKPCKVVKEFSLYSDECKEGDVLNVSVFEGIDKVDVTGTTKGRGFQGVIKRFNGARGPKTHGGHCYRIPGSIGNCSYPAKVWKAVKMPGQMGNITRTVQNLQVVHRDVEKNLLFLKGAVPGHKNGIVFIKEAVKG